MKKLNFTGLFLILILIAGAGMTLWALPQAVRESMPFDRGGWVNGTHTQAIENAFDQSLPVTDPAIDAWDKMGFALFGEGRRGVLVGTDGWLFSAEEFEKTDGFQDNINANLAYITAVRDALSAKKIALFVIPVPSKARVQQKHLGRYEFPAHWTMQYEKMAAFLDHHKIPHADLLPVFEKAPNKDALFLKTDTHWSPDGARRAAQVVAARVSADLPYLSFAPQAFQVVAGDEEMYEGDLLRFIGKNAAPGLAPDRLRRVTLDTTQDDDLFGARPFDVVLVGTSFSANEKWGFAHFLKAAMHTDILNRADQGLGPFEVMQSYLESENFKKAPPRLVLWEVPERYLPVRYELQKP